MLCRAELLAYALHPLTPFLPPQSLLLCCRIAFGVESPDLAAMLIKHGRYMPRAAWDLWALGLLALDLVGGERPEDHRDVLLAPVYMAEAMAGIRDPLGLPGQRGQMEYLAAHVTHESSYADKVCDHRKPASLTQCDSVCYAQHHLLHMQGQ